MLSSRGNFRYFESDRLSLARTKTSTYLFLQHTITVIILLTAIILFPFFLNYIKKNYRTAVGVMELCIAPSPLPGSDRCQLEQIA